MRKFYTLISIVTFIALVIFLQKHHLPVSPENEGFENEDEDIKGAIEDRLFTSSDVDLGVIPVNKLFDAIQEGHRRLEKIKSNRSLDGSLTSAVFHERGPNNVGGRTRSMLVDEKDPNRNRIWLGGVSGGLWRTEDITQQDPQWTKLGIYFESTSIGDIAQDPNELNTVYVGT